MKKRDFDQSFISSASNIGDFSQISGNKTAVINTTFDPISDRLAELYGALGPDRHRLVVGSDRDNTTSAAVFPLAFSRSDLLNLSQPSRTFAKAWMGTYATSKEIYDDYQYQCTENLRKTGGHFAPFTRTPDSGYREIRLDIPGGFHFVNPGSSLIEEIDSRLFTHEFHGQQ